MPLLTLKDKKSLVRCQGKKWSAKKCTKGKLSKDCTIRKKLERKEKNR